MKTALVITFKGTNYCGWQVQSKSARPSVQKTLQNAVEKTLKQKVLLSGCSRTDSGVHAREYYCHLNIPAGIRHAVLPFAINKYLPGDIAVTRAFAAPDDFHARYSAMGKEYTYLLWNSRVNNPFFGDISYKYIKNIDVAALNHIGAKLAGQHDFAAFMSARSGILNTVRNLWYFKGERDGDFVKLYIAGDGFLYNMARIMVGTVLEICRGRIRAPIEEIIESGQRQNAGQTVPAKGLCLNRVFYPETVIKQFEG